LEYLCVQSHDEKCKENQREREREKDKVNVITVAIAATIVTRRTDEENGTE
jgi:hypothetical protein